AELTIVRSEGGGMDKALTRNMIAAAHGIRDRLGGYLTDQLSNPDQIPAYHAMGEEIWQQTGGRIDAFVQMTGTAASSRGVSEALHRHNPEILCVAVEPSESAVLSGGATGVHRIEGAGAGYIVPLWKRDAVDEIATVSTDQAMEMARRLTRVEGLCAGTSTGGNVAVAIEVGQRLGREATVVTIMCDSGNKYLTTSLYGA
ncbi:MAG TPA: pyridoxal-phosphate dependent enzyme, partial [Woeseiaceae bacterium]|nr:pyridoxal-phosphate dependent enzyme [Woeseiaceae bacterium]